MEDVSEDKNINDISGISSIVGDPKWKSVERTAASETLFASEQSNGSPEDALADVPKTPVFQLPVGRAPRKTPRTLQSVSQQQTPKNSTTHSSGGFRSRVTTPNTSGYARRTPRSARSDVTETPRNGEPSNIVAIVEGRGLAKGEIGMASIDLRNPILQLSQFTDSQTYVKMMTRLQILSPIEILFPSTMCDAGNTAKIFKVVDDNFQNSSITTVQRHYFNETKGFEYIKEHCVKEHSSVEIDVQGKYYCLSAAAALMKYVEFIQNVLFASRSLRITFQGSEQTTLIDASTATSLELVVNMRNPKDESLFGVLNHTRTPGGARLLRSNILQPPNDLETINTRQDCVQELTDEKELFFSLKDSLNKFSVDLDSLLSSVIQIPKHNTEKTAENSITTCIMLKHVLESVPTLEESLSTARCDLFRAYHATLKDARFGVLLNEILDVIHEDVQYQKGNLSMKSQRCFAVKQGINGLLDASRRTYTELIEDINDAIAQLSEKHNLPLRCAYNASRGFFLQMTLPDKGKTNLRLPSDFQKVSKTKKTLSCTTDDMIRLNERVNQVIKNIYEMASVVVSKLLAEIRGRISCLYNLSETLSTLDLLLSYAHTATTADYVRPEFTDTLAIKKGRHPVLEKIMKGDRPIPNDVYASDETNFNIITGPNMSGKSTYLKQVALLQIMAQIGSFVPAEYASFRLTDQIFSRVGSDDDIETNASTFTLEMREINYIIQNVTDNSLVIIDELGRGTSSEEGVGLCWSIAEFILSRKAFTLFATHFLELCRLDSIYPNVENYHFKIGHVITKQGEFHKIVYTYLLTKGHTEEQHYGLKLAEIFNFPELLITRAKEIAQTVQDSNSRVEMAVAAQQRKEKITYRLANRLLQISRNSLLDDDALKELLLGLKSEYLRDTGQEQVIHDEEPPASDNEIVEDVAPRAQAREATVGPPEKSLPRENSDSSMPTPSTICRDVQPSTITILSEPSRCASDSILNKD